MTTGKVEDSWVLTYLASNPDLARAFGTDVNAAAQHWLTQGQNESRRINDFAVGQYLALNPDVAAAVNDDVAQAKIHYITKGLYEGRQTSILGLNYLASNPDLIRAFGLDSSAALRHWNSVGVQEGRRTDLFDPISYMGLNTDVAQACNFQATDAAMHYILYGLAEGRSVAGFSPLRYVASNSDLIAAFGTNEDAALRHWVMHGAEEGRQTSAFNPHRYYDRYPDLQFLGDDVSALSRHYIEYGHSEGRTGGINAPARVRKTNANTVIPSNRTWNICNGYTIDTVDGDPTVRTQYIFHGTGKYYSNGTLLENNTIVTIDGAPSMLNVATDGEASSPIQYDVRVYDGYDWGAWTSITAEKLRPPTYYEDALIWKTEGNTPYVYPAVQLGRGGTVQYGFLDSPPAGSTGFTPMTAAQRASVRLALAQYALVANITFVEITPTADTTGAITFWTADIPAGGMGTPGGQVVINTAMGQDSLDPGSVWFETVLHETGHALGLKHPGDYDSLGGGGIPPYLPSADDNTAYSVMSYHGATGTGSPGYTPAIYDIATIQYLYGANTQTRTGDDVYTLENKFRCIWDAGGTNTFSGADQSMPVSIDLRPGTFSSVDGVRRLSIAYGTTITGAIGGTGDDTLHANSQSDTLDGGLGQDTAAYDLLQAQCSVIALADGQYQLTKPTGVDLLKGIEQIQFTDTAPLPITGLAARRSGSTLSDQAAVLAG